MAKLRIAIIHGSYGSPDENWFPWLAGELRAQGCEVVVPRFPTPEDQSLPEWQKKLHADFGELDERSMIIAHSIGCAFALQMLSRSSKPIRALFLVAGFIQPLGLLNFDSLNSSFLAPPLDWDQVRERAGKCYVYAGENDPYVPLPLTEKVARELHISLTLIPNGGHLNTAAGFTEFANLYADIVGLGPFF